MILNSRNNNFIVSFTKGFFPSSISQKYETYIKRLPIPYENLHDYMTASVQSMTFPSLTADPVEQILYEDNYTSKGGLRLDRYLDRDFTITFKLYEGYINYWIMFDTFRAFYDLDNKESFLSDVTLSFLDQTGFEFIAVEFHQILITNISEVELNYSSNTADFQTFNATFKYNYIKIKKRFD
jgi:hypothetical protein